MAAFNNNQNTMYNDTSMNKTAVTVNDLTSQGNLSCQLSDMQAAIDRIETLAGGIAKSVSAICRFPPMPNDTKVDSYGSANIAEGQQPTIAERLESANKYLRRVANLMEQTEEHLRNVV